MNSKVKLPRGTGGNISPKRNSLWNGRSTGGMADALNVGLGKAWDKSQLLFHELNCVLKVIQNHE